MLNISNYQRNANQKYNEVLPHTGQNGHQKSTVSSRCGIREMNLTSIHEDAGSFLGFFLFVCHFLGCSLVHMEVPGLGVESELQPPEPQQHRIQAASATYTTAHSNTRSLTH